MASRDYVRLWSGLALSPKWGRLSAEDRGVWVSLLACAGLRNSPTFDFDEACWLLRDLDPSISAGNTDNRVVRSLHRLIELGWLDAEEGIREGSITLHDWDQHQPQYRGPSDDPEYKAWKERERRHTLKESGNRGNRGIEERRGEEKKGEEKETGLLPTSDLPWDAPNPHEDAYEAYRLCFSGQVSDGAREWVNRLGRDHGEARVAEVIFDAYRANPRKRDFLSRVEQALIEIVAQRETRQKMAAVREAEKVREEIRKEQEMTPEQKERAKLQQKAIRIGVSRGLAVPTDPDAVRAFIEQHEGAVA